MKIPAVLAALFILMSGRAFCGVSDWDDIESAGEVSYESRGRASGARSHRWSMAFSRERGAQAGMYLIKDESPATLRETHMMGVYGSRSYKRVGFKASYALRDRSLSGTQGRNFFSGGLRVTPFPDMDLLVDYDRVREEFITGEDDLEKETLSAGLRLKAFDALRLNLAYAGENLMRVKVSYGW
ncbi:MAG: hypothetical protein A3A86_00165 [Elusimicrobia bacterium RIFCSPLOWO2_01_FULL_60_11]|nr:MAG: hypothetical protein A3A86_00165 [Elusimicrobia bacterium RIFCSPLOWO2_01_FULL_60_11]